MDDFTHTSISWGLILTLALTVAVTSVTSCIDRQSQREHERMLLQSAATQPAR